MVQRAPLEMAFTIFVSVPLVGRGFTAQYKVCMILLICEDVSLPLYLISSQPSQELKLALNLSYLCIHLLTTIRKIM